MLSPKLRTVQKSKPPYPLNEFSKDFGIKVGKELIYLLATKQTPSLEGDEWEQIFANCIGAEWKPSNVGLDDVVFENCAFGAKTVKNKYPAKAKTVRLISGRNSPTYSFGESKIADTDPDKIGEMVLSIWNDRVSEIRKKYKHLRTVVLLKSDDLTEVSIFEFETIMYSTEDYQWDWNEKGNLQGYDKNKKHKFTWQPSGSQFTIIEEVPENILIIKVKKPEQARKDDILASVGFENSWIEIRYRG